MRPNALLKPLKHSQVDAFAKISRESYAARHINVLAHLDDTTLVDKNDQLIRLFVCHGLKANSLSPLQLEAFKARRNQFFKTLNPKVGFYCWTARTKGLQYPEGKFEKNAFAQQVNQAYYKKVKTEGFYQNQYYLALVTKPPESKPAKLFARIKKLWHQVEQQARHSFRVQQKQLLEKTSQALLASFAEYDIRELTVKKAEGQLFSEPLTWLASLINLEKKPIPLLRQAADTVLCQRRISFDHQKGLIAIRKPDNSINYAAILGIKGYCPETYAGLLEEIESLPMEFVITQSFRPFHRDKAKQLIQLDRQQMSQAAEESFVQTTELSDNLEEVSQNSVGYGLHHFTLCLQADSAKALDKQIATLSSLFDKQNLTLTREDIACELGFWAQLPGNFAYVARSAKLKTSNLAGFVSLHNSAYGKPMDNYWGECVTVLETINHSPYYFNFHYQDVGLMLVFGVMGAGKTTLVGFLLLMSLKFGGKRIVFDRDKGLFILVKACGGAYIELKPNQPTGLNPCQLPDTPENRAFLQALFSKLLTIHGNTLNQAEMKQIHQVVTRLYNEFKPEQRRFRHVAALFGTPGGSSLRERFNEWHSHGRLAWIFDHEKDSLNFNATVVGVDVGQILNQPLYKTPVFMYLFHRAELSLEGQRGGIIIDEGWQALDDPFFAAQIEQGARTHRKKDNFLVLMTQNVEDTVNSKASTTLNDAATVKVFYPNRAAKPEIYQARLGLSDQDFQLVKALEDASRFFLLQFGRGRESEVVRLNLSGLEAFIRVISGRENTVKLLETLLATAQFKSPKEWLPEFIKKSESL